MPTSCPVDSTPSTAAWSRLGPLYDVWPGALHTTAARLQSEQWCCSLPVALAKAQKAVWFVGRRHKPPAAGMSWDWCRVVGAANSSAMGIVFHPDHCTWTRPESCFGTGMVILQRCIKLSSHQAPRESGRLHPLEMCSGCDVVYPCRGLMQPLARAPS